MGYGAQPAMVDRLHNRRREAFIGGFLLFTAHLALRAMLPGELEKGSQAARNSIKK